MTIRRLIDDRVDGFAFRNDQCSWPPFLSAPPCRDEPARMGAAAARAVTSITWLKTARGYLADGQRLASC